MAASITNFESKPKKVLMLQTDFRPSNMLMQYEIDDQMSEEDLMEVLGKPLATPRIRTIDGRPSVRAPRRLVQHVDLTRLALSTPNRIAIVDFGCSYTLPRNMNYVGIPLGYSPPEAVLQPGNGITGGPSDIWSLACSITEVITATTLPHQDYLEAIQTFECLIGPLPEPLRTFWKESLGTLEEGQRERVEALLEQPPDSTGLLAPVSISTDELRQKRVQWEKTTGYTDYLKCILSHDQRFYSFDDLESFDDSDYTGKDNEDEWSSNQGTADSDDVSDHCKLMYDPWSSKNQPDNQEEMRLEQRIAANMETAEEYRDEKAPSDSHSECPTDEDSLLRVGDESPARPASQHSESWKPGETRRTPSPNNHRTWDWHRLSNEEIETISNLLYQMFRYDPKERITAQEVLDHEWFRGLREASQAERESRDVEKDKATGPLEVGKRKPKRPAPSVEAPRRWERSPGTGRLRRVED